MRNFKLASHDEEIIKAYKYGASLIKLAKFWKVAPMTIRSLLVRNNVTIRSKGPKKENINASKQ